MQGVQSMEFAGLSTWNRSLSAETRVPFDTAWYTTSGQWGTSVAQRTSLLVVDPTVTNYQQLIVGIAPGTDIVVLDPTQDAIAQITHTLLQRSGISSLHIVSHGKAGAVQFGANWLDATALDRDSLELQSWFQAFTEDADILLYGCEIAAGEQGQAFIQKFSELTGADIAASTDLTGNVALSGDWELEARVGQIESAIAFQQELLDRYQGVLAADLISVANPTLFGNNASVGIDTIERNAISGDGRFVVFTSSASTLASNDTNSASDVFLYDRQANTVTLISRNVNNTGTATGTSYNPVMSYDGNYVAFISNANDLINATVGNTTNADNIFVWERATGTITLVSKDQNNTIGTLASSIPSISDDGAYIAFQSQAKLAATDGNVTPRPDVYVWSRSTDSLTHLSRNRTSTRSRTEGAAAPMISGDGNYVVFTSLYTNLSSLDGSGQPIADSNGFQDVFLWDRSTDSILNLTVRGSGTSSNPFINRDGSRVAFVSEAGDLVVPDSNAVADVFVWTRSSTSPLTGSIQLISINQAGTDSGNAPGGLSTASGSQNPILSRDGSRIAFTSSSTDLVSGDTNNSVDVFVRDLNTNQTILVNRSSTGTLGNSSSDNVSLSSDGNLVVFTSTATNLIDNDTNSQQDVFVRDLSAGTTSLISRTPSSSVGNNISGSGTNTFGNSVSVPVMSGDGMVVAFVSQASNLADGDNNGVADGFVIPVAIGNATLFTRRNSDPNLVSRTGSGDSTTSTGMSVSTDGRFVVFTSAASEVVEGDTNGTMDVFLRDRQTGTTQRISRSRSGNVSANGASNNPLISADGRYIVFTSNANDLVNGDANGATDIFWYDTQQQVMRLVSRDMTSNASANGASLNPVISSDGRYVAFTSTASNLVNGDTNSQQDVFIWDSQTQTVTIVSRGAAVSDGVSEQPVISSDGRYVAFVSAATNLVSGDTNGKKDVFVWDRTTNSITLVSRATGANGAIGDGDSYQVSMSQNGRVIAFTSTARNLANGTDNDSDEDVFVRDLDANTTALVSVTTTNGYSGNSGFGTFGASNPVISGNGQFVAFTSNFSDLVNTDTNAAYDVFLRNLATNQTQLISINQAGTDSGNASPGSDGGTIGGFGTGSLNPVISNDGRYVAFSSFSSNLVSGDANNALDVFIRDTRSNSTTLVSRNLSDTASSNGASFYPVISSNGTYVAFSSVATDLTSKDFNGKTDVFGVNFAPSIAISTVQGKTSIAEVSSNPSAAQYRIRRLNQTSGTLTVKLSIDASGTSSSGDFTITTDPSFNLQRTGSEITLDFADGVTEAILNVTAIDDIAAETSETVVLNVIVTPDYAIADSAGTATITITDSDTGVTNTNDQGEGSLRQAILNANANAGQDTIRFQIAGSGVQIISLASALPTISDAIVMDGTTQTGFSNTPLIVLDGTNAGVNSNGLILNANNSTVKALEIRNFAQDGILITSSNNTIERNVITANQGDGIAIDNTGTNNRITSNSIVSNGGLGIDLGRDGITANDDGDLDTGANNLQNTVVIAGAEPSGADAIVRGTFNGAANSIFRVEFFKNTTANSEGQVFLQAIDLTTDDAGQKPFNLTIANLAAGEFITATVTDANGNTSEFSNARVVGRPKVSISAVNPSQKENAGGNITDYMFVVSLDQSSGQTITARVNTTDKTATSASDYTAFDQTLTFAPGETSKTITVQAIGDRIQELDETFMVSVTPLTNADAGTITSVDATIENDDLPPNVTITNVTPDAKEGNSGDKDYLFEVRLSEQVLTPVSVSYTTKDGTATVSDTDYVADSNTLTFSAGETLKTITIRGKGDTKFEQNETFTVELSNITGDAQLGVNKIATGTIENDDNAPTLTITGGTTIDEGQTGNTNYVFTVSLSEVSSQPVTVEYGTSDLEATVADSDYVANSNTLSFAPGVTSQSITVVANGDRKFERDERFQIDLKNPTGAILGGQTSAIGTIQNDDSAPTISISSTPTVAESNNGTTPHAFVVSLSGATDQTVSVVYGTEDGSAKAGEDYVSQSGTLTFAPGDALSKTVTVNINGDTKREGDETFSVKLSNAENTTITNSTATVTLTNDDIIPTASIQNITASESDNDNTSFQFEVTLSNASDQIITIPYTTEDGSATIADQDYESATGTLTFNPGDLKQTIVVNVKGDTKRESNETFTVKLGTATNASVPSNVSTATGNIQNDDPIPSVSVTPVTIDEGGILSFVVNLSNASSDTIIVDFATSDGTAKTTDQDYTSRTGTLTFAPNQTSQTITVQTTADTKLEADETINLTLSNPTNATIETNTAIGTIRNDDQRPTLGISNPSGKEGDRLAFVVSLSNPTELPVNVVYGTIDDTAEVSDSDYTSISGTLTFNPGEQLKTIFVDTTSDRKFEPDERFILRLLSADNADLSPSATDGSGILTNDDSRPSISVSTVAGAQTEGNSGTVPFLFEVSLSNPSSETITVNAATVSGGSATDGVDYTAIAQTLTFNPGQDRQTLTVFANGDTTVEADENFIVRLSNPTQVTISNGAGEASGIILNDDQPPRPTISIDDVIASEGNNGTVTYRFKVKLSQQTSNQITVDYATSNDTALVSDGDYVQSSGQLVFAANEVEKEITVTVNGDTKFEDDERFFVTLSNATNADLSSLRSKANGIITNDDAKPRVTIASVTDSEGDSGTKDFVFNVSLSNPSSQTVTVAYDTQDGSATITDGDYQTSRGTLTFAPGVTLQAITVKVNGDRKFEPNETFSIRLTPTNADLSTAPGQGIGTILPDDFRPTIAIRSDVPKNEGNSGNTPLLFYAELSNPSSETVSVQFATRNGSATDTDSDFVANSGQLTFAPGETIKTITVQAIGDTRYELNEAFGVELSNPTNASLGTLSTTGSILNDDPLPQLSISATSNKQLEGKSGTTPFTFVVSLNQASPSLITVGYTTADGTATLSNNDYVTASGTLTFAAGETQKTITVNALGDSQFERDETFRVNLSSPTNATIATAFADATIQNDDIAPMTNNGLYDIFWRNQQTGENTLWLPSTSLFNQSVSLPQISDLQWKVVGRADIDGNGSTDLLWYNSRTGESGFWQMQQNQMVKGTSLPTVSDLSWEIKGFADFNRDRKPDILWRNNRTGDNGVWLLNGTTVTAQLAIPSLPDTSWTITGAGDFNNDGNSDILWQNNRTGENALWQMNGTQIGAGRFLPRLSDLAWKVEETGDFNSDGFLDILWRNQRTGEVATWLMQNGIFQQGVSLAIVEDLNWKIQDVGDFNGDSSLDLLWRNHSTQEVALWYLNGARYGTSASIGKLPSGSWTIESIGDFNSDRKLSIVIRDNQTGDMNLWLTHRNLFTQTTRLEPLGNTWKAQGTSDFDNDGHADILWRDLRTGELRIWFTQSGQLRNQITLPLTVLDTNWSIQGTGDVNRDGSRDIFWRNLTTGELGVWFLNQGEFVNAATIAPTSDLNWSIEKIADFNGDGNVDLLWRNHRTGDVGVWLLNQTTVVQRSVIATVSDLNWKIAGIGDVNRDGSLDFVWRNYRTGETGIWLMNGTRYVRTAAAITASLDWVLAGMGDFNNDSQLDLLWRNTTTGSNAVWYLNGGNFGLGVYIDPIADLNWKVEGIDNF
jgi:hypothetical protein